MHSEHIHTFIHSYIHTFIHSYIHTALNKCSAAQCNVARDCACSPHAHVCRRRHALSSLCQGHFANAPPSFLVVVRRRQSYSGRVEAIQLKQESTTQERLKILFVTCQPSLVSDSTNTLIFWDFVSLQEATRLQGKGHNSDRTRLVISSACPTSQCPGGSAHKFVALRTVSTLCIVFGRYFTLVSLHLWRCLRFSYRQCGRHSCLATETGTLASGGSSVSVHRQYGGRTLLCSNRDRSHREHAPNDIVGKFPVRSLRVSSEDFRTPVRGQAVKQSSEMPSALEFFATAQSFRENAHLRASTVSQNSEHFHCWRQILPLRGVLFHPASEKETVRDVTEKRLLLRVFIATQCPNRLPQRRRSFVMSQRNVCYIVFSSRHRAHVADLLDVVVSLSSSSGSFHRAE